MRASHHTVATDQLRPCRYSPHPFDYPFLPCSRRFLSAHSDCPSKPRTTLPSSTCPLSHAHPLSPPFRQAGSTRSASLPTAQLATIHDASLRLSDPGPHVPYRFRPFRLPIPARIRPLPPARLPFPCAALTVSYQPPPTSRFMLKPLHSRSTLHPVPRSNLLIPTSHPDLTHIRSGPDNPSHPTATRSSSTTRPTPGVSVPDLSDKPSATLRPPDSTCLTTHRSTHSDSPSPPASFLP